MGEETVLPLLGENNPLSAATGLGVAVSSAGRGNRQPYYISCKPKLSMYTEGYESRPKNNTMSNDGWLHKCFRSQKSNLGKLPYYHADILTWGNNLVLIIPDLNLKTSTTNKTNEAVYIILPLDISHQHLGCRV